MFHVRAPAGQLVRDSSGETEALPESETEDDTIPTERQLALMHPAMFGNHPFYFIGLMILMIGGLAGAVIAGLDGNIMMIILGAGVAALGVIALGIWWIQTRFRCLEVTDKRTIYRRGVFSKQTSEVQHDDVRNMQADQSFFDRIVGVGHVAISSSGQDDMEIDVRGLKSPNKVIEIIRKYQ